MSSASSPSGDPGASRQPARPALVLLAVFALAALALSFTFRSAEWRAESVLIPRYCDQPERHLALIRRILVAGAGVDHAERRAHMVAAKLLFVVPRGGGETVEAYLARLRARIAEACA